MFATDLISLITTDLKTPEIPEGIHKLQTDVNTERMSRPNSISHKPQRRSGWWYIGELRCDSGALSGEALLSRRNLVSHGGDRRRENQIKKIPHRFKTLCQRQTGK